MRKRSCLSRVMRWSVMPGHDQADRLDLKGFGIDSSNLVDNAGNYER
jgi:hypothetical protein